MKTIYIIHQYFTTPCQGGATRLWYLAHQLVKKNFNVKIITSEKTNKTADIPQNLEIISLNTRYNFGATRWQKIYSYFAFIFKAVKLCSKIKNKPLLYVSSTPLTVAIIGIWLKKTKNIEYILELRDIWPLQLTENGLLKNILIIKALKLLEKKAYKNTDKIVCLTPQGVSYLKKYYPGKQILFAPNFAPKLNHYNTEKYNQHTLKLIYAGTINKANNPKLMQNFLNELNKQQINVELTILGRGRYVQKLVKYSTQLNNITVKQQKWTPKHILYPNLANADFSIAFYPDSEANSLFSPNKIFDSWAAGTPVITNLKGWLSNIIIHKKCGILLNTNNIKNAIYKANKIKHNAEKHKQMRQNALNTQQKWFTNERICNRIICLILK